MRVVAGVVQVVQLDVPVHVEPDARGLQAGLVVPAVVLERGEQLGRVHEVDAAFERRLWDHGGAVGDRRGELGRLEVSIGKR